MRPGSTGHLFAFMQGCGFTQALAIAPFEPPLAVQAKARIEGDGLAWLLAQPQVGLGADAPLQPVAAINPALPGALEKRKNARKLGVRMLKFHPLILAFDVLAPARAPFLEEAQGARMPVKYHTGIPEGWGIVSNCLSPRRLRRARALLSRPPDPHGLPLPITVVDGQCNAYFPPGAGDLDGTVNCHNNGRMVLL